MDMDISTIEGSCHCGAVRFRVRLTDGLSTARRCTCSYCRMRGAVAVSAEVGDISFRSGEGALTLIDSTQASRSTISARNAASTHHRRRSNPNQYGVNVACLEGVSPF